MSVDPSWKGVYRAGGISTIIAGILLIINILLFLIMGPAPNTGEGFLKFLSVQKLIFQTVQGIFALVTVLFIPTVFALYLSLKEVKKTYMLIASGLSGASIALFLVRIMVFYPLVRLSNQYVAATNDAQRATYAAVAELVLGANAAGVTLAFLILSVSVIIISLVMLKGIFNKGTAYLGLLTGIVGIVAQIPISFLSIVGLITLLLLGIWFLAVGAKLYKLA